MFSTCLLGPFSWRFPLQEAVLARQIPSLAADFLAVTSKEKRFPLLSWRAGRPAASAGPFAPSERTSPSHFEPAASPSGKYINLNEILIINYYIYYLELLYILMLSKNEFVYLIGCNANLIIHTKFSKMILYLTTLFCLFSFNKIILLTISS